MGRAQTIIPKEDLLKHLLEAESTKDFSNWSELFDYVADTDWGKSRINTVGVNKPVSGQTIYQRVIEYKLDSFLKTKKGKRGREKGAPKIARTQSSRPTLSQLRKLPDVYITGGVWTGNRLSLESKKRKFIKLIERVEKGSYKAGVILNCWECSAGVYSEIRSCECTQCPLFSLLPRGQHEKESLKVRKDISLDDINL